MADLQQVYNQEIREKLQQELSLSNAMEVPRIIKITLNMGVGEAVADRKQLEAAVADLELIAGQKPVLTKARKSIAGFKIYLTSDDFPEPLTPDITVKPPIGISIFKFLILFLFMLLILIFSLSIFLFFGIAISNSLNKYFFVSDFLFFFILSIFP